MKSIVEKAKESEFYNLPIFERLEKMDEFFDYMKNGVGTVETGRKILEELRGG
jgi:hypothetical protein